MTTAVVGGGPAPGSGAPPSPNTSPPPEPTCCCGRAAPPGSTRSPATLRERYGVTVHTVAADAAAPEAAGRRRRPCPRGLRPRRHLASSTPAARAPATADQGTDADTWRTGAATAHRHPVDLAPRLLPGMRERGYGRIVAVARRGAANPAAGSPPRTAAGPRWPAGPQDPRRGGRRRRGDREQGGARPHRHRAGGRARRARGPPRPARPSTGARTSAEPRSPPAVTAARGVRRARRVPGRRAPRTSPASRSASTADSSAATDHTTHRRSHPCRSPPAVIDGGPQALVVHGDRGGGSVSATSCPVSTGDLLDLVRAGLELPGDIRDADFARSHRESPPRTGGPA